MVHLALSTESKLDSNGKSLYADTDAWFELMGLKYIWYSCIFFHDVNPSLQSLPPIHQTHLHPPQKVTLTCTSSCIIIILSCTISHSQSSNHALLQAHHHWERGFFIIIILLSETQANPFRLHWLHI